MNIDGRHLVSGEYAEIDLCGVYTCMHRLRE